MAVKQESNVDCLLCFPTDVVRDVDIVCVTHSKDDFRRVHIYLILLQKSYM